MCQFILDLFFIQWKCSSSLSSSLMRTCRKACFMSPHCATGKNLFLTSTLQSRFCNAGPVSKHSFNKGLEQFDLAEALYTILIFVLSAFLVITGLCGIYYSLPFGCLLPFRWFLLRVALLWCYRIVQISRGPSSVFPRDSFSVIGFQLYYCLE